MPTGASTSVYDCTILPLKKARNRAGNLTCVDGGRHLTYQVRRIYFLYDVPGGAVRGGHAHKTLHQFMVAAAGSFDIHLDDGLNRRVLTLNRPDTGLLIVPGIWRELVNFSSGSVCLVLASAEYNEADYIRSYAAFEEFKCRLQ